MNKVLFDEDCSMKNKLKLWGEEHDVENVDLVEKLSHCIRALEEKSFLQPSADIVPGKLSKGELYWALVGARRMAQTGIVSAEEVGLR